MKIRFSKNPLPNILATLSIIIVLFSSCGNSVDIPNFDEELWINDQNGCTGDRLEMIDEVKLNKDLLIGLSTNELRKVLGRPDNIILYTRNQKYYHYYLTPGKQCQDATNNSEEGQKLIIKMSALDKVSNLEFPLD
ncbi:hypothetical protein [Marinigracilibium pacificum]|uniref:Uncharacterized protein n=1 Tax=Marinigracilibium pacificum TaxID=2729599 RepID=A0A848JBQ4_9BACT|nr:hypothetical protein [Marinigracilibium pacificum]NMM50432.1 hypothetical protein [Marinigracilibium pacificum]